MAKQNTITNGIDEKNDTNPEFRNGLEDVARSELIKDDTETIRFSIANAMDVYRELVAKANEGGQIGYLGGRLG